MNRNHIHIYLMHCRNETLEQRDWFGGKLGQYVTGLVATCQNPRDFHGRNLVDTLRYHVSTFSRYWFNLFAYNWALIGLHNSGEPIDDKFVELLLQKQTNGSFGSVGMHISSKDVLETRHKLCKLLSRHTLQRMQGV